MTTNSVVFKNPQSPAWLGTVCGLVLLSGLLSPVNCLTFSIPATSDIVGEIQTVTVAPGESLGEIGRKFDIGVCEMIEANPNLNPWRPIVGSIVIVPTQFILPKVPRVGLVLNLAEMRLYYFHPNKNQVTTHPFGIGKKKWPTPMGVTSITRKQKNPIWYPPASIRQEHLSSGEVLPAFIPPGPDNPLGNYALYFALSGLSHKGNFLMHGTNRPGGVGVRTTHGCIRLFPEDIESLYEKIAVKTPVRIIHEPYKIGWHEQHLYLEAHQPLTEAQYAGSNSISRLEKIIESSISGSHMINWASAKMSAKTANGYPVRID